MAAPAHAPSADSGKKLAWSSIALFVVAVAAVLFNMMRPGPPSDDPAAAMDALMARGLVTSGIGIVLTLGGLVMAVRARRQQTGRGIALVGMILNGLVLALLTLGTLQFVLG